MPNYVEPFAGSLAVLLGRPTAARVETVNDLDCYVANFWRAIQSDPEAVARHADWPVNEADLHARHVWLVGQAAFRERVRADPDFYDSRVAGWWVWGICQWIGSGWCTAPQWNERTEGQRTGQGIHRKRPRLDRGGRGISRQLPDLSGDSGATGRGIHAIGVDATQGGVMDWILRLSDRLRYVRVCCGDWSRILGPAPTTRIGVTAVILDPPYAVAERDPDLYAHDSLTVAHDVRVWAIANGDNPDLRIALCGYEGEHAMPGTWRRVAWKAAGGFGSARKTGTNANAARERIWFSPHCLHPQLGLFE